VVEHSTPSPALLLVTQLSAWSWHPYRRAKKENPGRWRSGVVPAEHDLGRGSASSRSRRLTGMFHGILDRLESWKIVVLIPGNLAAVDEDRKFAAGAVDDLDLEAGLFSQLLRHTGGMCSDAASDRATTDGDLFHGEILLYGTSKSLASKPSLPPPSFCAASVPSNRHSTDRASLARSYRRSSRRQGNAPDIPLGQDGAAKMEIAYLHGVHDDVPYCLGFA
jgi:hypothetical protein